METGGVLFTAAAMVLVTCNAVRVAENVTFGDTALVAGTGFILLALSNCRGQRPVVPTWLIVGALGVAAAGALSTFGAATATSQDLLPALALALTMGVLPIAVMLAGHTRQAAYLLTGAWLVGVVLNCVVALTDVVGLTSVSSALGSEHLRYSHRASGLTIHPNHLAVICAMALPVAAGLTAAGTFRRQRTLLRGCSLVAVGILVLGLMVSGSRAGAAAGFVGLIIGAALMRNPRYALTLVGAGAVVLVVTVLAANSPTSPFAITGDRLTGLDPAVASSDAFRQESFTSAISGDPSTLVFGQGFSVVRDAHSIYLQLLQAGGLIALIAFGVYAVGALRTGLGVVGTVPRADPFHALGSGLVAAVCAWLVYGVAQNQLYDRYLYIPVGLLLAIAAVLRESHWRSSVLTGRRGLDQRPPRQALIRYDKRNSRTRTD